MDKKKGFTLIELLVVISIIALLLSILMPSLQKVKQQARILVCKSNLHQLGVANVSYAADNNDWFPGQTNVRSNPMQLQSDVPWALGDGNELTNRCRGMWATYIGYEPRYGSDSFYCPSSLVRRTEQTWLPDNDWAVLGYTYFGNYKGASGRYIFGSPRPHPFWKVVTSSRQR